MDRSKEDAKENQKKQIDALEEKRREQEELMKKMEEATGWKGDSTHGTDDEDFEPYLNSLVNLQRMQLESKYNFVQNHVV